MSTRIPYLAARRAQPAVLHEIHEAVLPQLEGIAEIEPAHVAFVGIGASHAAGAAVASFLRSHGLSASRHLSSERAPGEPWPEGTLLVAISQSGRSRETIDMLTSRDQLPGVIATLSVTNQPDSPVAQLADHHIVLGAQPDSYASTIGYTGTVLALDLLATSLLGLEPNSRGWVPGLTALEKELPAMDSQCADIAGSLLECTMMDVVAEAQSMGSAEATALLLREVARVPSSAFETRNYLHGAMESAGGTGHVFFGDGRELEVARTLHAAGNTAVAVGSGLDHGTLRGVDVIDIPTRTPIRPVAEAMVGQSLAEALAKLKGLDIEAFVFDNADTKVGPSVPALDTAGI